MLSPQSSSLLFLGLLNKGGDGLHTAVCCSRNLHLAPGKGVLSSNAYPILGPSREPL
nr:MAG TPA: hypothetical protein [Caudoviricetes sp.]